MFAYLRSDSSIMQISWEVLLRFEKVAILHRKCCVFQTLSFTGAQNLLDQGDELPSPREDDGAGAFLRGGVVEQRQLFHMGLHLDRGRLRVVRRVRRLEQLPEKRALGQDLHGVQQPGRLG